jgi:hypothetical protein
MEAFRLAFIVIIIISTKLQSLSASLVSSYQNMLESIWR